MTEPAGGAQMGAAGCPHITGWEESRRRLSGSDLVSDSTLIGLPTDFPNNMLFMDGEQHRIVRRVVMGQLSRARLTAVKAQLEVDCEQVIGSIPERADFDFVTDLAEKLVLTGILSVMGVPRERWRQLGGFARGMIGMLEPDLAPNLRQQANGAALRATLMFERDGRTGRSTGLHATLEQLAGEGVISEKLARSTPVVVLHGGYENPLNQLGCVIAWAAAHPGQFRSAATSPTHLFEEILRVYSPVRLVARWTLVPDLTTGRQLNGGEFVWVDLESANLDDRRFPEPGTVDPSVRRSNLGFGYGRHACPGAALARIEGEVLIQALRTLPSSVLDGLVVRWRDGAVAHGPAGIARG